MASNQTPTCKGAYCCVVGCHRETVRDRDKVNFFYFPTKNQEKRQLWIKAVNRSFYVSIEGTNTLTVPSVLFLI